jgi:hypothetical protein
MPGVFSGRTILALIVHHNFPQCHGLNRGRPAPAVRVAVVITAVQVKPRPYIGHVALSTVTTTLKFVARCWRRPPESGCCDLGDVARKASGRAGRRW